MNLLKQIARIGIFFVVCAAVFSGSYSRVFAAKAGDKCGNNNEGACQSSRIPILDGQCPQGGKAVGECNKDNFYDAWLYCCIPEDKSSNVPTTDDECAKAGGGKGTCQSGPGCDSGYESVGYCGTKGFTKPCCVLSGTSTGSGTSSSSGTASLKYTPLENLPGFENQGGDFAAYFGNLYKLALWIVGISALFMLVVGGFLYLSSAGNTALLGTAKKTIYSALIGLVIALVSWLLLDTINSDLTNLKLSGLSGAISSGSSSGTGSSASAGTGSGGSTATGTYTHAEAAAALSAAGIGITSSSGRIGCSDVGCTTLEGIPKSAIDNLISIKKDCGCSFNVTGGTEAGHASHGSGKPIVDVTQDTTLGNFLYSKAGGSGGATITKSPGYGISKICVTTAWEKLNFGCGSYRESAAHFHLVF